MPPRTRTKARGPRAKRSVSSDRGLPPIPSSITLPAGAVSVGWRANLEASDASPCWGLFEWGERRITIREGLALTAAWLTLEHEAVHAILYDAGVELPSDVEERVCDAIAQARVAAMRKRGT
jgi:hypothetical protein